jgi:diguanylate cyclase (GGDEF)-like protein
MNARTVSAKRSLQQLQRQVQAKRVELQSVQIRLDALRAHEQDGAAQDLAPWVQSAIDAQVSALAAVSRLDALAISMQRDALTNTPNRALLLDRLQSAIALAQRRSSNTAVVFLDVDHFKHINDTLGHATGDAVLQMVARRLQAAVRDSDAVGRHGGDEFLVLLAEVSRQADAAQIARKIISDVAAPILACGHLLQVSVSAGIALYPEDASDAQSLISLADAAMYRSKRSGGGCYTFHSDPPGAVGGAHARA